MLRPHLEGVRVFDSSVTSERHGRSSVCATSWRKYFRTASSSRHVCSRFTLLVMLVVVVEYGRGRESSLAVLPASAVDTVRKAYSSPARTAEDRARVVASGEAGNIVLGGERLETQVATPVAEEEYIAATPPHGTAGRLSRAPFGEPAQTATSRESEWKAERPGGEGESDLQVSGIQGPAQGWEARKGPTVTLPAESGQRQRLRRRQLLHGKESGEVVRESAENLADAEEVGKEGKSGTQQEEELLPEAEVETDGKKEKAEVTAEGQEGEEREGEKGDEGIKGEAEQQLEGVGVDPLLTKEFDALEKALASEPMITPSLQHPLCAFANLPWCGGDKKQPPGTPLGSIYEFMREMDAHFRRIGSPMTGLPFLPPNFWKDGFPDAAQPRDECRLTVTLDPLLPMEEVRLYITLSDRKLGLAANSTVKRSEQGKAYFRAYGSETRLQAIASIPDQCMLSKKLVEAGLIGWSYGGQALNGSKQIDVPFPSAAHAEALLGEKKVTEEAYKALRDEEGLEKLTPLEKCLLSGRTQTECEQLKAEASEPEQQDMIPSFSSEGYGENEIRLPRFVYT